MFFFFFKQKTAYDMRISDWSSDVCSSDLVDLRLYTPVVEPIRTIADQAAGPREAAAELCERRSIDREAHRVCEQAEKVRRRLFQQNLQACRGQCPRREYRRDRKSVGERKSVCVRVDLGGGGIITKKT